MKIKILIETRNKIHFKQDKQCTCNIILRRVRVTIVAVEQQYTKCVFVALHIQHAMRMRRVILSSVASPAVHYLSVLPHKHYEVG